MTFAQKIGVCDYDFWIRDIAYPFRNRVYRTAHGIHKQKDNKQHIDFFIVSGYLWFGGSSY